MVPTDATTEPTPGPREGPGRRPRRLWALPVVAAAVAAVAVAWSRSRPDPDALYERARVGAQAGRYREAEGELERLARLRPPTPADRLVRAQVAAGQGQIDSALAELAGIPDGHPLGPLARLSEGQLEARRGRLRKAEAAFRATLALEPKSAQARRELVYIFSVQQRLAELDEQLDALSEQGALELSQLLHWGLVRHVEWAAATDLDPLRRYVAADPDDRHSRLALAEAQLRTGRVAEAAESLEPLPVSDPDVRAARARLALARGDLAGFASLLADGPADHPALARLRGDLAMTRGDPRSAADHFRLAAARSGDRATLFSLATALTAAGDDASAGPVREALRRREELGELLRQAKSQGDDLAPDLLLRLGRACLAAGRPLEARAWLKRAIARDPLDAEAQHALNDLPQSRPAAP